MKVIFLSRYNDYHQDQPLYDVGTDEFFSFGMGQFIAQEYINRQSEEFEFENWRADKRISEYMEKDVNQLKCRIYPSKNIPLIGEFSLKLFRELRILNKREDVTIHVMSVHVPVMYLYVLFIRKSNLIATHLGGANPFWNMKNRKGFLGILKSAIYYQLEKRIFLRQFNHLITPCKDEAEYFDRIRVSNSHMPAFGISRSEIFNIESKEEARKRLCLPMDKKILLQVGRAIEARGFDWIMNMLEHYKDKEGYLPLFAGISKEDEYYEALLQAGAQMTPYLKHTDLPDYYNAADILYYLPHGKMDLAFAGTSYVPLEAMLCGTPVVSTTFHHFPDQDVFKVSRTPRCYDDVIPMIEEVLSLNIQREIVREIVLRNFKWQEILDKLTHIYKGK